jgi:ABC-2 type transport system ATP-binding protein
MPIPDTQNAIDTADAALPEYSDPEYADPEYAVPEYAVEVRGLDKRYGASGHGAAKHALIEVDLAIPRGALFGLLGPNGAGKSTLINILAGLVNKSAGSAAIWGFDIERQSRRARAAIGVVPQELNIDPFFTPRELLELQAGLYGVPPAERRSDEILEVMGLSGKAEAYARTLSGGMRRRLMVAKAMVHNPPVLVLDEPRRTDRRCRCRAAPAALVPRARAQPARHHDPADHPLSGGSGGALRPHRDHQPRPGDRLRHHRCDRIAIINHGRVIACDTTAALLGRLDSKDLTLVLAEDLAEVPAALLGFHVEIAGPRRLVFHYRPSQSPVPEVLRAVAQAGLSVVDMTTEETDLEDLFLQLTRAEPGAAPESHGG